MNSNTKKLYAANFLTGVVFWYAIEKLFMQSIGISSFGIAINAVVLLVILIVFDVPSGILADKWKRKHTLILAILALGFSNVILGLSNSFIMYLFGTVLYGGYIVLTSGTFQAIMYDSLAETGEQNHYDKHQGRAYGLFFIGVGLSSLAGGYIAEYVGLRETYLLSVVPALLCLFFLFAVTEPKFHKETFDSKLWPHLKTSAKVIMSQPAAFHLALFLVIAGVLRSAQNEFSGLYYIGLSLSAVAMGYLNAAKWVVGALGQFLAPYLGNRRAFQLLPWLFVVFAIFSLVTSSFGIVFFLLAYLLLSMVTNQAEANTQSLVPSHVRATTLSLISFVRSIVLIPLSLLFGWLTQQYDVFKGYQLFAAVGLVYMLVWLLYGRRRVVKAAKLVV